MHTAEDLDCALALVRVLIDTRTSIKERLEEPAVKAALRTLGDLARSGADVERLTALSTLSKAAETHKPIAKAVERSLKEGLDVELPPLGTWGVAEDRFYLAKAVEASHAEWIARYAADALARAEINEKLSRNVWASLAVNRANNLAEALGIVSNAFAHWLKDRRETPENAYRKIIRICLALSETLATADVRTGEGFGKALLGLVSQAGGAPGAEAIRLREESAAAFLDLVTQTLRLRFELLFDSDIFRSVGIVRGWWRPAKPPDDIERRTDRIARLAVQALHILGRQGVRDVDLRRGAQAGLGADRVNKLGRELASADPSLSPAVSHWLASGQDLPEVAAPSPVSALLDDELDESLGRLMIAAEDPEVSRESLTSVADAIELFEAEQAAILRRVGDRLGLVSQWIRAAVAKRRLELFGQRGESGIYDPAVHDAGSVIQRGSPVRTTRPGVLRAQEGRPPVIVLKALVEAK